MKTTEKLMGLFIGIFIMLIFCSGIKAKAIYESLQFDYSPDGIYKYETNCEYYGILADTKNLDEEQKQKFLDCINPELNFSVSRGDLFTERVQFSERLNYMYNYTEEDNVYIFNARSGYENYDINYLMVYGFGAENSAEAKQYIKNILVAYKAYDTVYEYSGALRIYMQYATDIQDIYEISDSIISISDVQVDENGCLYYDVQFDESCDYYYAKEISENFRDFEWYDYVSDIDFVYNPVSVSERIIVENPVSYSFDDGNGSDCPITTTTAPQVTNDFVTTTKNEIHTTTTSNDSSPEPNPPVENTPDINGDGQVNIADAVIIKSILRGDISSDSYYIDISDVNNDAVIDEFDYMTIYSNIIGYGVNLKSITVNINSSEKRYADCYVKIIGNKYLSDMTGKIYFQKNILGRYIDIVVNDVVADDSFYIFNERYNADYKKRYRLITYVFYDDREISVEDSCII